MPQSKASADVGTSDNFDELLTVLAKDQAKRPKGKAANGDLAGWVAYAD